MDRFFCFSQFAKASIQHEGWASGDIEVSEERLLMCNGEQESFRKLACRAKLLELPAVGDLVPLNVFRIQVIPHLVIMHHSAAE